MHGSEGLGNDLLQVEDVDKKFAKLEMVEKNGWEEEVIEQVVAIVTKKEPCWRVARKRAAVVVIRKLLAGLKALIAAKEERPVFGGEARRSCCQEAVKEMDTINIIIDKASDDSSLIQPQRRHSTTEDSLSVKSPARRVTKSPQSNSVHRM